MRKILAAKPSITDLEIAYVTDAVTNGWGERCYDYLNRFKICVSDYFGSAHVWPTSSCHGALHIVLKSLGVGPGDEVIVPDATWTGSVFPISWLGAKPIFVDVLPDTWCIDPQAVKAAISKHTKAIIAVHLYGNLCEMDELLEIGNQYQIPLIEDAAEAIGSKYKGQKAGSIGDFGVFSLHGTKTLTAGEGGLIISNRSDLFEIVTMIESQGRRPGSKFFWVDEIGLKYKMSNLQAALGLAQFERVEELVESKQEIFHWYREELSRWPDVLLNPEQSYVQNSYWMPTIVFGQSYELEIEAVISALNAEGIAARPFFFPVSSLPMYQNVSENMISYLMNKRALNLPNYFEMSRQDVEWIVQVLEGLV
jgi:perosamine synthetase